jgi:DNA polymerase III delta prime subunit
LDKDFLWCEVYRPHTISETILPDGLKKTFQAFVDQKNIPNLILTGTSGVGKTTVARAMLDEVGADYIIINGSDEGRSIDILRTRITNFATTVSLAGGRKYVIIDEADYMNPESIQPALRRAMEEFSKNCGFILTCNFPNRLIPAMHSRSSVIDFTIVKEDKPKLATLVFKRLCDILNTENVVYDKAVVAEFVKKYYPDTRRILNELQRYSAGGDIDAGVLVKLSDKSFTDLMNSLKAKRFNDVRKWVAESVEGDTTELFRKLYDTAHDNMKPTSIPQLVVTLAEYQYKAAFVPDQEINMMACLSELMVQCEWK